MNRGLAALAVSLIVALAPAAARAQAGGWQTDCPTQDLCIAARSSVSGAETLVLEWHRPDDGLVPILVTGGAAPADPERAVRVVVDGKAIATVDPPTEWIAVRQAGTYAIIDATKADAVLKALEGGKSLRIEYLDIAGRPYDADFDLTGYAQALDGLATRAGVPLKRRSAALPANLPLAGALDRDTALAELGVPSIVLDRHMASADCEDPTGPAMKDVKPIVGVLSATATLYAIGCIASAGEADYRLYVLESGEIGGVTPLYFAGFDTVHGWSGTDRLRDVGYDPATKRLTAQGRVGGAGQCGFQARWTWRDHAFALDVMRAEKPCGAKGAPAKWPVVFGKG
jgi:invasion protein IalB